MANTHINRLRCVVTNTPGTSGNFVVGAAPAGRRGFSAAEDGKTFELTISEGNAWEVRTGCVYTHSTTTVTRGTLADSSTGSAINFTAAAVVSQGPIAKHMTDLEPLRGATLPQMTALAAAVKNGAKLDIRGPYSAGVQRSDTGSYTSMAGASKGNALWASTIWLPCGVDAVRIGLVNNATDVSTYSGVLCYAQTTDGSDLMNPRQGATQLAMQLATWNGANNPTFVNAPSAANPNIVWSDWVPVVNTGTNSPSWLIVRTWYPNGVAAGGGFYAANAYGSRTAVLATLGAPAAYYTAATNVGPGTNSAMTASNAVLPVVVQLASRKQVPCVWIYGDSTRQGYYSDGVVSAAERYAIASTLAGRPVAADSRAISGQTTAEYIKRLRSAVAAGERCDVLIYQVASPNDGFVAGSTSPAQIARAQEAILLARQMGAHIILDGPFPMTATTPTAAQSEVVTEAQSFCNDMAAANLPYVSACMYETLHDGTYYGKWNSAYNFSGDGLHQNTTAMTSVIVPAISSAIDAVLFA